MSLTTKLSTNSQVRGFTMIELVIVIIVLGVLAAGAIPKLTSKSSFEHYTLRDQLIARLRLVQLQGMNADPTNDAANSCYWLVVKNDCFYHERTDKAGTICNAPSVNNVCSNDNYNEHNSVAFTAGMLDAAQYRFDLKGKLIAGAIPIEIKGDSSLYIKIESEGYIHE